MISPVQIRAGRALLGWTQDLLAYKARVSVPTVKNIEGGKTDMRLSTLSKVKMAFLENGVVFFDKDDAGGMGVRFRQ